jgi:hypothetical protein
MNSLEDGVIFTPARIGGLACLSLEFSWTNLQPIWYDYYWGISGCGSLPRPFLFSDCKFR